MNAPQHQQQTPARTSGQFHIVCRRCDKRLTTYYRDLVTALRQSKYTQRLTGHQPHVVPGRVGDKQAYAENGFVCFGKHDTPPIGRAN